MMIDTQGRRDLAAALESGRCTQIGLGREIGQVLGRESVAQATVRAWALGLFRPKDPYREAMASILGIATESWLTDEERGAIDRARAHRPEAAA